MSERPPGIPAAREPEPRDSASGVVVRRNDDGRWQVLLGLRARGSRFMPGHLAFPGGALDPVDRPQDPGALLRCVEREFLEETGIEIPSDGWIDAGVRITPPMFPVRFRTRFFVAALPGNPSRPLAPRTPENEDLRCVVAAEAIADWAAGASRIPPPVLPILRVLDAATGAELAQLARRIESANAEEQRAPRIEFAPDVWMLPVRTATLPPATHTNVWMPGGREFVVIDPGCDEPDELRRLLAVIERRRELGGRPTAVLLTHRHPDHCGGAEAVARELRIPLRDHADLADGDRIDLAGMELEVLHTPGHAADHLAFHIVGRSLLVAGDLVGGMSTILIDPDRGDMDAYLESLARVAALDCRLLLPGHGPPLPGREASRVIAHRHGRERKILEQLARAPASEEQIAREVYRDVPQMPLTLTSLQTRAHLVRLERRGQARRDRSSGRWSAVGGQTADRIRELLTARLAPSSLEVADETSGHVSHEGAAAGGGHFRVRIVADAFGGRTRVEQHRMVYDALAELRESGAIHALGLETRATGE